MNDNRERTDTVVSLQRIESNLEWHNSIGKGMFAIGLILIGLSVSTLVYFGRLDERVSNVQTYTTVLDVRISENQEKIKGQFLRLQSRMRDVEHNKHKHDGGD